MSRGSSPKGSGLPEEEDPPRISNKKKIVTVDLVELVKDQKTRKGLNYVIQAVEQIKKDNPFKAENLNLDRAIAEARRKFPENSKKVPSELPLVDIIMFLNRGDRFSHTIERASIGVLIGLILYYLQLNLIENVNNDQYDYAEEFMDQIKIKLEKEEEEGGFKETNLYNYGITHGLLDIFITYLNGRENHTLKSYFTDLKSKLSSAENVKSIAANKLREEEIKAREEAREKARVAAAELEAKRISNIEDARVAAAELEKKRISNIEDARVAAAELRAKQISNMSTRGSITISNPNKCKNTVSCVISGGKRKIRKSRKVSKKSRKTRRRK